MAAAGVASPKPGPPSGYKGGFDTGPGLNGHGSLQGKLPTIWTDETQRWEESEKRREDERRSEKRKRQKEEDADGRKGAKVANPSVFPVICGSAGSKSRLAEAAGAEPSEEMGDEKLHAVVTRSTCRSENVQNTSFSEHFRKLRCRKSARRCGAKQISKSKCTKHTMFGPLLEVEMSKKCNAVVARSTFGSQNVRNTPFPEHFLKLGCGFVWQAQGILDLAKSEPNARVL